MQPDRSEGIVLVVEDDRDCLDAVCELLRVEGYRTVAANNGQDALDYLRRAERPQLILLDLMMPVMNGWQFLDSLRRTGELALVPVVILSADGDLAREARALDVAGYISKPVMVEALLNAVRRHIGAR